MQCKSRTYAMRQKFSEVAFKNSIYTFKHVKFLVAQLSAKKMFLKGSLKLKLCYTVVKWGHTEGIPREKTLSEKYTVISL